MYRFYAQLTLLFTFTTLIGFACTANNREEPRPAPADSVATVAPRDSVVITEIAADTTDAFSILQTTHTVVSRPSALGVFVQKIDSLDSGGGAYWVYSVNDSLPMVAADRFQVVPGDTVRWHLRFSAP